MAALARLGLYGFVITAALAPMASPAADPSVSLPWTAKADIDGDAAVRALAVEAIGRYKEPDRATWLSTVAQLQLAARRYEDAEHSLAELVTLRRTGPQPLDAAGPIVWRIYARARQIEAARHLPFAEAYAKAFTTGRPAAHDIDGVIAAGVRLIAAFRTAQLPVVVTRADLNAPPAGRTVHSRPRPPIPESALAIVPAIGPQPGDVVIGRRAWSPFAGTDLDARLRSLGVTQVVFSGLATSFGIESGVRAAYDLGYHVVVATDAITDPFVERHDYAVSSVFPILAELGTSEEIACLLAARR